MEREGEEEETKMDMNRGMEFVDFLVPKMLQKMSHGNVYIIMYLCECLSSGKHTTCNSSMAIPVPHCL